MNIVEYEQAENKLVAVWTEWQLNLHRQAFHGFSAHPEYWLQVFPLARPDIAVTQNPPEELPRSLAISAI